jgi:putative glycosyltransferase
LIDSDLEEEPEWLIPFHEKKIKTKSDVVYGVQILRKGHLAERFVNGLYYPIISLLSSIQIPRDMVTARLMSRRYTLSLLRFRERDLDLGGLWCLTGYSQVPYPVTKHSHSPTTYTFRKKLSLFFNSVTSFSSAPLLSIFYLGMSVFIVSIGYSTWVAVRWLFTPQPIEGWTSLIISIWLTSGLLIMSVGVVGIYLAHVFNEVKRRPYTIVRELYRH